jgi:hypothetical protein
MRLSLSVTALAITCAIPWTSALAHMLPEDVGLGRQVEHQLFGAHHLPLLFFATWLAVLGVSAARRGFAAACRERSRRSLRKAG